MTPHPEAPVPLGGSPMRPPTPVWQRLPLQSQFGDGGSFKGRGRFPKPERVPTWFTRATRGCGGGYNTQRLPRRGHPQNNTRGAARGWEMTGAPPSRKAALGSDFGDGSGLFWPQKTRDTEPAIVSWCLMVQRVPSVGWNGGTPKTSCSFPHTRRHNRRRLPWNPGRIFPSLAFRDCRRQRQDDAGHDLDHHPALRHPGHLGGR